MILFANHYCPNDQCWLSWCVEFKYRGSVAFCIKVISLSILDTQKWYSCIFKFWNHVHRIVISQYGLTIFIYVAIDKLNIINDCSFKHLLLRKQDTQLRKVQKESLHARLNPWFRIFTRSTQTSNEINDNALESTLAQKLKHIFTSNVLVV